MPSLDELQLDRQLYRAVDKPGTKDAVVEAAQVNEHEPSYIPTGSGANDVNNNTQTVNGTQLTPGTSPTSPGGSDTNVQYNNAGGFGGSPKFIFDVTTATITLGVENTISQLLAPNATTANTNGGTLLIKSGNGDGSASGGTLFLLGGQQESTATAGTAGNIFMLAGSVDSGGVAHGGSVVISGGNSNGTGAVHGGSASMTGGSAGLGTDGNGGLVTIHAGTKQGSGVDGDVYLNWDASAHSTSANGGFVVIPFCAGTPTGTPTVSKGPLIYDTSANKLWIYNGSWRSVALT